MSIALLFWIIWLIAALFGAFVVYTPGQYKPLGSHVIFMILLFLLGWRVFGFILHG